MGVHSIWFIVFSFERVCQDAVPMRAFFFKILIFNKKNRVQKFNHSKIPQKNDAYIIKSLFNIIIGKLYQKKGPHMHCSFLCSFKQKKIFDFISDYN